MIRGRGIPRPRASHAYGDSRPHDLTRDRTALRAAAVALPGFGDRARGENRGGARSGRAGDPFVHHDRRR